MVRQLLDHTVLLLPRLQGLLSRREAFWVQPHRGQFPPSLARRSGIETRLSGGRRAGWFLPKQQSACLCEVSHRALPTMESPGYLSLVEKAAGEPSRSVAV